jgi:4-hydroxy-3-polyprenylbenzoate decarboxylase
MGATILPAMPGFYHGPTTIDDLVDFVVAKVLASIGAASPLVKRWSTPDTAPGGKVWNEGEE